MKKVNHYNQLSSLVFWGSGVSTGLILDKISQDFYNLERLVGGNLHTNFPLVTKGAVILGGASLAAYSVHNRYFKEEKLATPNTARSSTPGGNAGTPKSIMNKAIRYGGPALAGCALVGSHALWANFRGEDLGVYSLIPTQLPAHVLQSAGIGDVQSHLSTACAEAYLLYKASKKSAALADRFSESMSLVKKKVDDAGEFIKKDALWSLAGAAAAASTLALYGGEYTNLTSLGCASAAGYIGSRYTITKAQNAIRATKEIAKNINYSMLNKAIVGTVLYKYRDSLLNGVETVADISPDSVKYADWLLATTALTVDLWGPAALGLVKKGGSGVFQFAKRKTPALNLGMCLSPVEKLINKVRKNPVSSMVLATSCAAAIGRPWSAVGSLKNCNEQTHGDGIKNSTLQGRLPGLSDVSENNNVTNLTNVGERSVSTYRL